MIRSEKNVFFCPYWSSVQINSENCSGSSKNSLLKGSLVFVSKKTFSVQNFRDQLHQFSMESSPSPQFLDNSSNCGPLLF